MLAINRTLGIVKVTGFTCRYIPSFTPFGAEVGGDTGK